MPRQSEESSPASRHSPRAAVKASATPSPIIRKSRTRSSAKPKRRIVSPSLKSVNMAAPLAICTMEEQRAVIRFLWSEGVSGAEIHQRLLAQYGDSALSHESVYEWIEKFKIGQTSVTPEEGAGHLSTFTTDKKIQQAQETEMVNQRVIIDEKPIIDNQNG